MCSVVRSLHAGEGWRSGGSEAQLRWGTTCCGSQSSGGHSRAVLGALAQAAHLGQDFIHVPSKVGVGDERGGGVGRDRYGVGVAVDGDEVTEGGLAARGG